MIKSKLITICALSALLLILSSMAKANQVVDVVDSSDEQPNTYFFPGGPIAGYLIWGPDWGWTHKLKYEGGAPPNTIISATLEIKQYGVLMYDQHLIKLDGESLGSLDNGFPFPQTHTSTFVLGAGALANLMDGTANMWLDIDWPNSVLIYSSRLTVDYATSGMDHITISGPTQVNEESGAQYKCTVSYSDGSSSNVTSSASWTENSDYATISSGGYLTTSLVSSDQPCRIKATYGGMSDNKDITIKNVVPIVSIAATISGASEHGSNGAFTVSRTGSTAENLQVYYDTSGSTATSGADYWPLDGYVDIQSGQTSVLTYIAIIDDDDEELSEIVKVKLTPHSSYIIDSGSSVATVTIADDDGTPPEISGYKPKRNSTQAPRDTIIKVHVTDESSDIETVTIHVEGNLIYDSANETSPGVYDSTGKAQTVKGICRRVGTSTNYRYIFHSSTLFGYEQKVDVVISATDTTGNNVTEPYYFYTVMRSFGRNVRVNSDTGTFAQNHPASAMDSKGNIWVVWDQTIVTGDADIYIGKLPEGESAFKPSVSVINNPNDQRNPAIAIDSSDKIYVTWEERVPSNNMWNIFVVPSIDGIDWTKPPVHIDPYDADQISPAIAIDGNDKMYIIWEDNRAGNKDIWVATSTGGFTWVSAKVTTHLEAQSEPAIAIDDADDTAYIVWTDARNAGSTDIYGTKSSTLIKEQLVNTNSNQSSPVVAISNGIIHLLWVDDASGSNDIFYGNNDSGLPFIGISIVDELNTVQSSPSIAAEGSKVFACWQDSRYVPNNNADTDIFYAEKTGSDFGTNILVNDDLGTYTQTTPVIGINKDGNPYMAWVDNRGGDNDIYYAGATSIGPALVTKEVSAGSGGTVEVDNTKPGIVDNKDDVIVEIPAEALPSDTTVTIAELINPPSLPPGGFGVPYEFGPSGLEFALPVTITIPHKAADCPGHSVYNVYFYDPSILPPGLPWSQDGITNVEHLTVLQDLNLPSDVHAIRFKTTHFTGFGSGGTSAVGGSGGGGGCSISAGGEGNIVEFFLPYIGFVVVLAILTLRDARIRKTCRT